MEIEDVELIKSEWISNPAHPLIFPTTYELYQGLEKSQRVLKKFKDVGFTPPKQQQWEQTIKDAMQHVGVVSHCIAIYITKNSDAKPSTRRLSMMGSKKLVGAMKIRMPSCLLQRFEVAMMQVCHEEKQEKMEKLGGGAKGGTAKRKVAAQGAEDRTQKKKKKKKKSEWA